jgi:hypothetical protein
LRLGRCTLDANHIVAGGIECHEAWQYQQTRRSLSAQPIHDRRAGSDHAKIHGTRHRPWLTALLTRRPTKVAAIALANKIARMAWAMMAKGERYKEPAALAA